VVSLFCKKEEAVFNPDPPEGCGEVRHPLPDGGEHVTRYTPDFRRSLDIGPDGKVTNDHIGPNAGIGSDRVPFDSPYDQWDPHVPFDPHG